MGVHVQKLALVRVPTLLHAQQARGASENGMADHRLGTLLGGHG